MYEFLLFYYILPQNEVNNLKSMLFSSADNIINISIIDLLIIVLYIVDIYI